MKGRNLLRRFRTWREIERPLGRNSYDPERISRDDLEASLELSRSLVSDVDRRLRLTHEDLNIFVGHPREPGYTQPRYRPHKK